MKVEEYFAQVGVPVRLMKMRIGDNSWLKNMDIAPADYSRYEKIYETVIKIVDDSKYGVFLTGSAGCGKSGCGVGMLARYLKTKKTVAYTNPYEIVHYYFNEYQGIRPRYTHADVLFIDDFSKKIEFKQSASTQIIEAIIKQREVLGKITLYGSTVPRDGIANIYSQEVFNTIVSTTISVPFPSVNFKQLEIKKYTEDLRGR